MNAKNGKIIDDRDFSTAYSTTLLKNLPWQKSRRQMDNLKKKRLPEFLRAFFATGAVNGIRTHDPQLGKLNNIYSYLYGTNSNFLLLCNLNYSNLSLTKLGKELFHIFVGTSVGTFVEMTMKSTKQSTFNQI
jgi:hypothetical protein